MKWPSHSRLVALTPCYLENPCEVSQPRAGSMVPGSGTGRLFRYTRSRSQLPLRLLSYFVPHTTFFHGGNGKSKVILAILTTGRVRGCILFVFRKPGTKQGSIVPHRVHKFGILERKEFRSFICCRLRYRRQAVRVALWLDDLF